MDPFSPSSFSSDAAAAAALHSKYQSPAPLLPDAPLRSLHRFSSGSPFSGPSISPTHSVEHLPCSAADDASSPLGGGRDLDDPLSLSPRVRSCDVYLGHCGGRRTPLQLRFTKWLRAELEMHGVSCFVADRQRYDGPRAHAVARVAMDSAALGVVVVTGESLSNPHSVEEVRLFSEGRKLVPVFFGLRQAECYARDVIERRGDVWEQHGGKLWTAYGGSEKDWREAVNGLARIDAKVEASASNMRDALLEVVVLIGVKLGRREIVEKVAMWKKKVAAQEFPFSRCNHFVGRKKELLDLEVLLFGDLEGDEEAESIGMTASSRCKRDSRGGSSYGRRGGVIRGVSKERMRKGKAPVMCVKSKDDHIEMQDILEPGRHGGGDHMEKSSSELVYRNGRACVCGGSGMGKTELLLEYAYRSAQRYKMVLWVGGEARYFLQNYMKLLPLLGVDVSMENELCSRKSRPKRLEDIEEEAILRVKKELTRDIPYLLVIDNLESEKDWWDGRNIIELLPNIDGLTHVLISTRLPHVTNIEPSRLLYLSGAEAMSLMMGNLSDLPNEDVNALRVIEEKLGRLPLGLSLVGAILSELQLKPSKLLEMIISVPYREFTWSAKEDDALRYNPFLIQILDVCFSILDLSEKPCKLATKMLQASGWFAPSAIPISMLAVAANEVSEVQREPRIWRKILRAASCMYMKEDSNNLTAEASSMLVRFRVARSAAKIGYIHIHDVVKLYARKSGGFEGAGAVVRAIIKARSLPYHSNHVLAVSFLAFKFGNEPAVMNLSILDLMSFIKWLALPLAIHSFRALSQCSIALEILRLSSEALELVEDSFHSDAKDVSKRSPSSRRTSHRPSVHSDPLIYREFAHLRAMLLETRANIMLTGGRYDVAKQLCRTAVSIKEVVFGWDHPETVATHQILERLIRVDSDF